MTAAVPFWDDLTAAWDKVTLGETTLPGVCSVDGSVKRDVEVKKSKGSDGATLKDNGYVPAPVSIEWRIYTREQWLEAQAFLPRIHPREQGGERRPVSIGHPAPNLLGVNTIYVTEIGFPAITGEKEISIAISAVEWNEKPKKPKPGTSAGSGGGPYNEDDLVEEYENKLIDALLDEAEQKAWAAEQEQKQGEQESWPFGEGDPLPWDPDTLPDEFVDNAEDGGGYDDEFQETTE